MKLWGLFYFFLSSGRNNSVITTTRNVVEETNTLSNISGNSIKNITHLEN